MPSSYLSRRDSHEFVSLETTLIRGFREQNATLVREFSELKVQMIGLDTSLVRLETRMQIREDKRAIAGMQWAMVVGSIALWVVVIATA
jgi:hypothetical protein